MQDMAQLGGHELLVRQRQFDLATRVEALPVDVSRLREGADDAARHGLRQKVVDDDVAERLAGVKGRAQLVRQYPQPTAIEAEIRNRAIHGTPLAPRSHDVVVTPDRPMASRRAGSRVS